ncbi:HAD family hydrolase [Rhodobacter capsulatus]|uniref:Haloacid dehalogenase superfamily, subfamily IA, variant 3 with third motif having DD or ED n=1 Tax=Rhodobacter capsulatus TaxID=1061 RepID=A0A1G7H669_RHOCA|nr:HAD family hydrolase [Rhodobacter capsulatus]SDE95886.1 haloacid dehalogenase superfamily, subfamily IA, variant 3 with third motif having DD or ED [Rhodobacter capsulatus]
MELKALIFDVDGTLAETEEVHRQAFNETFAAQGLDWYWSKEDYRTLLRTTGGKERMAKHRENLGSGPSDAKIADLHKAKTQRYVEIIASGQVGLLPGVAELIDRAKASGLRLAIATTTTRANVDALIAATFSKPAGDIFEVIAAGDEVAQKKPAPDVYLRALQGLGLPPAACLAFEDSRAGLASARAAGLRVVLTPSEYTRGDDFSAADWRIPDLSAAATKGIPNLP